MTSSELITLFQKVTGPIIEIAGPTPNGYELLRKLDVQLNVNPIVTNIMREVIINPHGENPTKCVVDEVADIKKLPYEDNSWLLFIPSVHAKGT